MLQNALAQNWTEGVTRGIRTITTDHGGIHAGYGYSVSGIFTGVANAATVNYAFKTPTAASGKYVHLKYKDFAATGTKVRSDLNEAPTNAPINGTDLAAINRNRVGTPTASAMQAVKTAMDINLAGVTVIDSTQFVSNDGRSLDIEFVLKPDTWYIRTFTNGTGAAADISFFEFWYEES